MNKILLVLIMIVSAISCNTNSMDSYEKSIMQERISTLEKRVDSLVSVLQPTNGKQVKTSITNKKKGKKNVSVDEYSATLPPTPVQYEKVETPSRQTVTEPTYSSSQCAAITKKGTRCKRAVRSGSYCWQHGG